MGNINLPKEYRPNEEEDYMNPFHLQYFKNKLLLWKQELLQDSLETLKSLRDGDAWHSADTNDLASFELDKAIELQSKSQQLKLINKIDEALEKIEKGEYGYCEETGEEIGISRLEARPVASLCLEAQENYEYHQKLYNDE